MHCEEETENTESYHTIKVKHSNQLSLPLQNDSLTRKDTMKDITEQGPSI